MARKINVYVISDATGATAETVLTSVSVQYQDAKFHIRRFPFTDTAERLEEIMSGIPQKTGMIVFTMVNTKLRNLLFERAHERGLTTVDVMGQVMRFFSDHLERAPKMKPGVFRGQREDMLRIAEAIHFALTHDDGLGMDTIDQADLLILGVSGTEKTPTSIYLACRNLKVANIPIICDVPLPSDVSRLPAKKAGLVIAADRLAQIRSERVRRMNGSTELLRGFSSREAIVKDLEYCEQVYRTIPDLRTVDVTNLTVELIAEQIARSIL